MKLRHLSKILTLTALGSAFFASAAYAQSNIKLAYALAKNSHYGAGADALEKELKERFDDKYIVEHFANSALGGEREVIEGLQLGTIDAAILSTGATSNFVPESGVFDIPFLFRDLEHGRKVLDGEIGQDILAKFPNQGLYALAWGEQGFRHLTNSKRPVVEPKDAKGLKIRTTENKIHTTAFKELGILATPMAWPEVIPALQQGTIDGQENPISVIVSANVADVQKYLSLTGHVYAPAVIVFSPSVYEQLNDDEKEQFKEASVIAGKAMRDFVDDVEKSGVNTLKEKGMEVVDDVNKEAFSEIVQKVYPKYYKQFNQELIESIRDTE